MSNVELPPLTHDKITQFDIFLNMWLRGGHSQPDPYFHESAEQSGYEQRAIARDIRAQVRISRRNIWNRISLVVLSFIFIPMWLGGFVLWIPVTLGLIMDPTNGKVQKDFVFGMLVSIASWGFTVHYVRAHLRYSKALRALTGRFPGSVGRSRRLEFLAWLDAHWPARSPLDEIQTVRSQLPGGDWDLESSYRGCPLLIRFCEIFSLENSTPWGRVSIYLSAPRDGVTNNQLPADIRAHFDILGYHAFRSPAGMYLCHNGRSLEALNPERIARLVELAYWTIHERNGQ